MCGLIVRADDLGSYYAQERVGTGISVSRKARSCAHYAQQRVDTGIFVSRKVRKGEESSQRTTFLIFFAASLFFANFA
jgi:hypothetical protein